MSFVELGLSAHESSLLLAWLLLTQVPPQTRLDLANNRLDAGFLNAFHALSYGGISIIFLEDHTAYAIWESPDEEFGSMEFPPKRLARPMLAECEA